MVLLYPTIFRLETCLVSDGDSNYSCLDNSSSINSSQSVQISVLLQSVEGPKTQCYFTSLLKAVDGWKNLQQKLVQSSLTLQFFAKVNANPVDAMITLGNSTEATFRDKPIAVRFSPEGIVDVRNGSKWTADEQIRYGNGLWYDIIIEANMASRTYSVYIGRCRASKVQLVKSASFRDGTEAISTISQISLWSNGTGVIEIANISWNAASSNQTTQPRALFFDDFSSGDFSKTMNGFTWGPTTNLQVIQGFSRHGNIGHCVRFNFDIPAEAVSELRYSLGASYQDIWFQYYLFYPNGTETPYRGPRMQQTAATTNLCEFGRMIALLLSQEWVDLITRHHQVEMSDLVIRLAYTMMPQYLRYLARRVPINH